MLPKVSIITVVRNNQDGLQKTLENLTGLDYPAVELVVVDGASTDGTLGVVEKFADRMAYWVSEPDNGLYDAMNKGILAATGDYLWFVNAGDTVLRTDCLSEIFSDKGDCAAREKYADIYFGETVVADPDGNILGLRKKKLPARLSPASLRKGLVVCHQSFIVRRMIAPLYDTSLRYVSDIDWVIRCLQNAKSVVNANMVLSCFETGGISTRHRKEGLRERWKVMRRYYGLLATLIAHMGFCLDSLKPDYRKFNSDL